MATSWDFLWPKPGTFSWPFTLGATKLSKVTAQNLDRTYAKWLANGASPTTIRHCHRVLATALGQAERWGLIGRRVTDLARPPADRAVPHSVELDPKGPYTARTYRDLQFLVDRPAPRRCATARASPRWWRRRSFPWPHLS